MRPTKMTLSVALAFLSLWSSSTASAVDVDQVSLTVETGDTYYASNLSINPIVVRLYIVNNTRNFIGLTNSGSRLGYVTIAPVEMMDSSGKIITSTCPTCGVVKNLFPVTGYSSSIPPITASMTQWICQGPGAGQRYWSVGPNSRTQLARIEAYQSDFTGGGVVPGIYEVKVILFQDFSITTTESGCTFLPTTKVRQAGTLIRIR